MSAAFAAALADPAAPVPEGLIDPAGRPAGARFAVYRNTVAVSLTRALEEGFPAIRALVGPDFFAAMAGVFWRVHPPSDPRLMLYGAAFPGFLDGFGPVAHLPYLGDVARLEWALRESYHAADAAPLAPADLAGLTPEALEALSIRLTPATRLLASRFPVRALWQKARDPGAPAPTGEAEALLIARPGFDPAPHVLLPGSYAFFAACQPGTTLTDAAATGTGADPGFDLGAALSLALSTGALTLAEPRP